MEQINIDVEKRGQYYKPLWKKLITAGRAHEGLRADWREQLSKVQREIEFEYIRFHGIFHDDMMVYHENENGEPWYNWQYVDSLLDFLLSINIRPIIELSFTPYDMRTGDKTIFWWKGNITPPKDYGKWAQLVKKFIIHCINRYGKGEISRWYFEVWNEANIECFWTGTQEEYFKLYEVTVKAIKNICKDFKVGGPATSSSNNEKAPWVEEFLEYCGRRGLPVDFISTHPYPNSFPIKGFGDPSYKDENGTYDSMVWLKKTVEKFAYKEAEIHITEWNSSPSCRDYVHDTAFMAPFIIQNNIRSIGLADSIGFWDITDIFEESGANQSIFHGGFGLLNVQGLEKPSYHGYWFLSRLGGEILDKGESYIVTRKDDRIQVLMWNYCHYNEVFAKGDSSGLKKYDRYSIFEDKKDIDFRINVDNLKGNYRIIKYVFDRQNGSVYDSWIANGAPENPDKEELEILRSNMKPKGSICYIQGSSINTDISIKPHGVVFIELSKVY